MKVEHGCLLLPTPTAPTPATPATEPSMLRPDAATKNARAAPPPMIPNARTEMWLLYSILYAKFSSTSRTVVFTL